MQRLAPIGKLTQLEHLRLIGLRSLRDTRQCLNGLANLKSLALYSAKSGEPGLSRECLAAVGRMTGLEELHLQKMVIDGQGLAVLGNLMELKYLNLSGFAPEFGSEGGLLAGLPALTRLETLDLCSAEIYDDDLGALAVLPRLKSLCLTKTRVSAKGLSELAQLRSLEELEIDGDLISFAGLDALRALKYLKTLHIHRELPDGDHAQFARFSLDDDVEMLVPKHELENLARGVEILRASNPRLVIDSHEDALSDRAFRQDIRSWIGFGTESLPEFPVVWLFSDKPPWLSTAERFEFEKHGGRASFDSATSGTPASVTNF